MSTSTLQGLSFFDHCVAMVIVWNGLAGGGREYCAGLAWTFWRSVSGLTW